MINLYQDEVVNITNTVAKVSLKWEGKTANGENLSQLHRELIGRLEDIGFLAEVDVTPVLAGMPVSVSILDRIDSQVFDLEKRQHELKELSTKNELDNQPQIEGNV